MSKVSLILTLIVILGAALRFFGLSMNPPSLNWDEISHGYNAYSILKTGTDEWGQLPLANFRAYGDYPLPLNMYFLVPFISVFGLNEFSIRLPGVILGTALILVIYFLAKEILKNEKGALFASFLLAISPWTILTSRQVIQVTPALLLFSLGILFFIKAKEKGMWFLFGTISFGLSAYAYHNTRILAPFIFLLLIYFYRDILIKAKKLFIVTLILAGIFFVPLTAVITSQGGSARAIWVGIINEGSINEINEKRGNSKLPEPLPQVFYNRVTYFSIKFAQNYIGYFSPVYLGFEGGTHYQFSIPHFGIVYPIQLPFFYLGLIMLLLNFKRDSKELKFLTLLLFLSPIPAAMTRDPYQVVRSSTMIPAVFIVSAYGFNIFYEYFRNHIKIKKVLFGLLFISLFIFLINYLYTFWFKYKNEYSFSWQYGYKEAVEYIKENGDRYEKIYFTKKYGEPHEFLLFYLQYNPGKYKSDPNLVRYFRSNWYWVDSFGKFVFVNDWEVKEFVSHQLASRSESSAIRQLLITSPGNYPDDEKLLKTINFLDRKPAFDIVELSQVQ